MGAIKELLATTLDRLALLGEVTAAGNNADGARDQLVEFFLTDEELWAIAYAAAPSLFVNGSLAELRTAGDAEHYTDLLEQVRDAYHAARNDA